MSISIMYIYIWFSVGQPSPMGMGVQSCFLRFPPRGLWWWGVSDVGDGWGCMDVWMYGWMYGWMDGSIWLSNLI